MKDQEMDSELEKHYGELPRSKRQGLRAQMIRSYIAITLISVGVLELLRTMLTIVFKFPVVPWVILLGVDISIIIFVPVIGKIFSTLSTRDLISRIRRLEAATARFAEGEYKQRLLVTKKDEIGQLEEHFNQMAEQLVTSIAQRQQLAEQGARMGERTRIARDLHDSVKQQAFAVTMQIGAALALLDEHKEAARERLLEAEALSHQIQQELTTLIGELRSAALQERGLALVLQDYIVTWSRQHSVQADIAITDTCVIGEIAAEALLRITQEALSNIARHSQATLIQVALECSEEQATLTIKDNGQGFDLQAVHASGGSGYGLRSMCERMETLGGTVEIESEIGQGTRLLAYYPAIEHNHG